MAGRVEGRAACALPPPNRRATPTFWRRARARPRPPPPTAAPTAWADPSLHCERANSAAHPSPPSPTLSRPFPLSDRRLLPRLRRVLGRRRACGARVAALRAGDQRCGRREGGGGAIPRAKRRGRWGPAVGLRPVSGRLSTRAGVWVARMRPRGAVGAPIAPPFSRAPLDVGRRAPPRRRHPPPPLPPSASQQPLRLILHNDSTGCTAAAPGRRLERSDLALPRPNTRLEEAVAVVTQCAFFT